MERAPTRTRHIGWFLIGNLIAVVLVAALAEKLGTGAIGLLVLPIVLGGIFFGTIGGISVAAANIAAGLLTVELLGLPRSASDIALRSGLALMLGAVVGRFRDLERKVQVGISERTILETAYDEARGQYEIVAETATDGIITINTEGRILYANPAVERILGYDPSGLIGEELTVIVPEDLREAHRRGFAHYLETGSRNLNWQAIEVPGLHASGRLVPLELSFGEYARDDRRIFTGILRDITERKKTQAELERLLDDKDEFVASVSHELRTPLAAVVGFARELKEGRSTFDIETQDELIATIAEQADDLSHIVEDLLAASRAESGQLTVLSESVDLMAEAKRVVEEGIRRFDGSYLHPSVTGGAVVAVADSVRVRQIMRNLLTNAARYGEPPVMVEVDQVDGTAHLTVTDHGPGIPESDREHIFDPYHSSHREKSKPGSVGLGLSVARLLARLMDGDLSYDHTAGVSQFILTLPLAQTD